MPISDDIFTVEEQQREQEVEVALWLKTDMRTAMKSLEQSRTGMIELRAEVLRKKQTSEMSEHLNKRPYEILSGLGRPSNSLTYLSPVVYSFAIVKLLCDNEEKK